MVSFARASPVVSLVTFLLPDEPNQNSLVTSSKGKQKEVNSGSHRSGSGDQGSSLVLPTRGAQHPCLHLTLICAIGNANACLQDCHLDQLFPRLGSHL